MTNRNLAMMTVALVMAMGSLANAELVGHWTFDDRSLVNTGTTGNKHNGIGTGFTVYSTGATGEGFALDMTPAEYLVVIDNSTSEDSGYFDTFDEGLANGMTIAFWAAGVPDDGWDAFISKNGENGLGYQVRRNSETTNVSWTLQGDGGGDTSTEAITEGWQHYAAVWTGPGPNSQRLLYINGELADTTDGPTSMNLAKSDLLVFGGRDNDGWGWFSGVKLDDIRIYNEGLSFAQLGAENISGVSFGSSTGIPTPAALPAGLALLGMIAVRRRR